MTMLIKYDTFSEDVTRFYMAECACAIEAVHNLGFVHRCVFCLQLTRKEILNPTIVLAHKKLMSIVLIDRDGHIKLSDFGLSTGFHRTHDSNYYQRLLSMDPAVSNSTTESAPQNIELTFSRQDRIATWKKNRRALVRFFFLQNKTHSLLGIFDRLDYLTTAYFC